ncbi:MAG: 4,5-DOPA dioxygenase extradiol [Bdellovibrionaceae bacterium]|nr:4,5-DOPA dioxygenase extradiol [Pseudobdellovibrionaceae bacterium]
MRQPVLFIGHGSPLNIVADNAFTRRLRSLGPELPRPSSILVVSAHWLTQGTRIVTTPWPETIHDFGGFPQELYSLQYPAPGAVEMAREIREGIPNVAPALDWGLDHGAWAVLHHLFPAHDIPVAQMSIDVRSPLSAQYEIARSLRTWRDRGVLIIGSGNITHNLRSIRWEEDAEPLDWAVEFDELIKNKILSRDDKSLVNPHGTMGSLAAQAHPSLDHYVPLLYTLGAADQDEAVEFPYEGIQNASISMRAVKIG